ncbi:MAG: TOBE domain-containing protein, partial [Chloroflexota bacterium]
VTRDGEEQQIGAPLAVYHPPATAFAARVLGSPSINLIPGELQTGPDGALLLAGDGFAISLPSRLAGAAAAAPSRQVLLGARPEDIAITDGGAGLPVRIDLVEPMGSLNVIYASAGAARIVATVGPSAVFAAGSTVAAAFDPERLHLFDAASGAALPAG